MADKLHSISTVSKITGVNTITLRAWQTRHRLIRPKRTAKGHRRFTDDDIVRIQEILFWLDKGVTISKVADYLQHKKSSGDASDEPDYEGYQTTAVRLIKKFDQEKLESYIEEIFSLYPLDVISQKIYPKVLEALSQHWLTSPTAFSEQQFFTFYLKNKIASTFLQSKDVDKRDKIIVTTLDEAFTELELLFLSAALSRYGFQIILLGRKTLPQEWPTVIKNTGAKGLVVSINNTQMQYNQVKRLGLTIDLPICVRTRSSVNEADDFATGNIHLLPENYHLLLSTINTVFSGKD